MVKALVSAFLQKPQFTSSERTAAVLCDEAQRRSIQAYPFTASLRPETEHICNSQRHGGVYIMPRFRLLFFWLLAFKLWDARTEAVQGQLALHLLYHRPLMVHDSCCAPAGRAASNTRTTSLPIAAFTGAPKTAIPGQQRLFCNDHPIKSFATVMQQSLIAQRSVACRIENNCTTVLSVTIPAQASVCQQQPPLNLEYNYSGMAWTINTYA